MTITTQTSQAALVSGIRVPNITLANKITKFIRDTESTLLFNHSSHVYDFFSGLCKQLPRVSRSDRQRQYFDV
jgi:hypothetical protein